MTLYTIVTIHIAVITAMLCIATCASEYMTRHRARLVAAAAAMIIIALSI